MGRELRRRLHIRSRYFALVVVLLALLGCAHGPCVTIVAPDGTTRATVAIEVANTNEQRERGLMFRKHLDDDAGMIFVFPDSQPRNFWMHNTDIPLDMIFADRLVRHLNSRWLLPGIRAEIPCGVSKATRSMYSK